MKIDSYININENSSQYLSYTRKPYFLRHLTHSSQGQPWHRMLKKMTRIPKIHYISIPELSQVSMETWFIKSNISPIWTFTRTIWEPSFENLNLFVENYPSIWAPSFENLNLFVENYPSIWAPSFKNLNLLLKIIMWSSLSIVHNTCWSNNPILCLKPKNMVKFLQVA